MPNTTMHPQEAKKIISVINSEGSMEYAFTMYSSFENVTDDATFHMLRRAYCAAHEALEKYLLKVAHIKSFEDLDLMDDGDDGL